MPADFRGRGAAHVCFGDRAESANLVKLSGNSSIASVIESLGEAIALTRKGGIDPHSYVEMLTATLFAAPIYKHDVRSSPTSDIALPDSGCLWD